MGVLKPTPTGEDYVLKEGQQSVWVTVGDVHLFIRRGSNHKSVEVAAYSTEQLRRNEPACGTTLQV